MDPKLLIYFALRTALQFSGRDDTLEFVNVILRALREATDLAAALKSLDEDMTRMVQEGRNPTPEEMQSILKRAQTATTKILGE